MTVIEAVGLRKAFGPVQALDGLDLSVPRGSVCALRGPNGAGKPVTGLRHSLSLRRGRWNGTRLTLASAGS